MPTPAELREKVLANPNLHVVDHPLVQHKLAILRDVETSSKQFRELVREIALFEGYEATRDFPLREVKVQTPVDTATCHMIAGKKVAIVPILRAGLGMVEGLLDLIPATSVGHVGMYRDPETHEPPRRLPDARHGRLRGGGPGLPEVGRREGRAPAERPRGPRGAGARARRAS